MVLAREEKPKVRATAAMCMREVGALRGKVSELEQQIATLGMKAAIDGLAARVAAIEAAIFNK